MDGSSSTFFVKPELTPERRDFYSRLGERHTAPLWEVLSTIVGQQPTPGSVPVIWHYDDLRPLLMEAGRLLTPEEAERRVLILENPGLPGQSRLTGSLYAGLQLILPGEVAVCHRHVASAVRFVIEGDGAYTAVEGERTTMHPGDFILTPSWTYHDHGNADGTPTVWLDGLDIPIVNMFDTSFAEHYPGRVQPHTVPEGDSWVRYGANMAPVDYVPGRSSSPIFNYPYARSRQALHELSRNGPPHPCHGTKMRFINPATGGYPLPTIGAFMQLLPAGFSGQPYRQTDGAIYCVVEGRGRTRIGDGRGDGRGDTVFEWGPRDIFVIPSWAPASHEADDDAVLFSMSDRPIQQAMGLWREQTPAR
jgi:gentisate 1,2-dioxygenase